MKPKNVDGYVAHIFPCSVGTGVLSVSEGWKKGQEALKARM